MYEAAGFRAIATTQSPWALTGGTALTPRIVQIDLGTSGTPTSDQNVQANLRRQTAVGTGTSVTPGVKGPGQFSAAEAAFIANCSAEPTYAAGSMKELFFNPRVPRTWQAYDYLGEFYVPLTANAGFGLQCIAVGGGAGNLVSSPSWNE